MALIIDSRICRYLILADSEPQLRHPPLRNPLLDPVIRSRNYKFTNGQTGKMARGTTLYSEVTLIIRNRSYSA
ncbi:hypothetical protein E4U50_007103 [Claviceps purpurea]|nr:hypothetical protein E4U50_007103 [Claviceps purpurea]